MIASAKTSFQVTRMSPISNAAPWGISSEPLSKSTP
jgi:hypothetical protein